MSQSLAYPMYLGPQGDRFFALLLPAQGKPKGAAVICQPWGREGIQTHGGLHRLARDLAAEGITVLRMTLPGCGHSEGDDSQAHRVDAWLKAIHESVDWLRTCTQVSHVHLLGLRTSAALAWQVASTRDDVASLVALAPTVQGRLYVRELKMLQGGTPAHRRVDESVLEATGFIMTPETQHAFAAIDLMALGQPAPRVLVQHRDDMPVDVRWARHLTQMNSGVTQSVMDGYAGLMADSEVLPQQAFKQILEWVSADTLTTVNDVAGRAELMQRELEQLAVMSLQEGQARITEQALFIPGTTPMFAVCIRPAPESDAPQPSGPAILILSDGANPVVGPQRMWIKAARQWAAQGYTVLRAELTGLNDSPTRPGEIERNIYSNVAVQDMAQAIDFLRTQLHANHITMLGLCSGAYHGFLAAVKSLPIDRAVMINPLVYHWEQGMSAKDTDALGDFAADLNRQTKSAFKLEKWLDLLRGKTSPAKAVLFIRNRLKTWLKQASTVISQRLGVTLPTRLSWQLRALARRRLPLTFIFADDELGLPLLQKEGGKTLNRSIQSGMVCIHRVEGGNHVFSDSEPRQRLMQLLHQILQPSALTAEASPSTKGEMQCIPFSP